MGAEEIVPEKPVKEQIRDQKRAVDRSKRNLIREQKKLEREKKKMLQEIKKMALKGQTTGAKMLAKDIVRSTNQIKKLDQFVGQLTAVSMRISSCSTLNELGDAMTNAANAMTLVSNKLDPKKMQQMAKVMAKEDFKLEMISDMMGEAMDSIGESMGNEEEEEELYNQVLAEAGVKLEGEIKEQKSLVEQNSSSWAELRYRMMVAAVQEKDNKEKSEELADAIFKMMETTDGQIKSVQEADDELNLLGKTVYLLTGNTDLLSESEKRLTEEQKDNIEALKILYKNNMLNEEQKKRLEDRYRDEIDLLKKQREEVKGNSYDTGIYTRRIEDLEKELGDLTGEEWDVKVEDVGTDETKQAIDEVGDSLDKIVNSDHTIEVKGNTSPFKKAVSGLLTNMGSTAFGLLFKGVGISFSSLLNKFKYAKGGIVNLPGYGVPIGGEAGREGVIPLTDEQQMQLLGESIGKYVTINLTNVTKLDSREINRKNEKVRSENTFIRNR